MNGGERKPSENRYSDLERKKCICHFDARGKREGGESPKMFSLSSFSLPNSIHSRERSVPFADAF
jgi:hypothetical protein